MYIFTIKDVLSDEILFQDRDENYIVYKFELLDYPLIIAAKKNDKGFNVYSLKDESLLELDEDIEDIEDIDDEGLEFIGSSNKNSDMFKLNMDDMEREFEFRVEKQQVSQLRNRISERLRNEASKQNNLSKSKSLESASQSKLSEFNVSESSSRTRLSESGSRTRLSESGSRSGLSESGSRSRLSERSSRSEARPNSYVSNSVKRSVSPTKRFSPSRLNANLNSDEIIVNFQNKINRQVDQFVSSISESDWEMFKDDINGILLEIEAEDLNLMRQYKQKLEEILKFDEVNLESPVTNTTSIRVSTRPITTPKSIPRSIPNTARLSKNPSLSSLKTQSLHAVSIDDEDY